MALFTPTAYVSWTPVITFATPGDLSVTYSQQVGRALVVGGSMVTLQWRVATSAFTFTTASGAVNITGNPFTASATLPANYGSVLWQGITKASYTQVVPFINQGASIIQLGGSGSGQAIATIAAADMPSAGTVVMAGSITFQR